MTDDTLPMTDERAAFERRMLDFGWRNFEGRVEGTPACWYYDDSALNARWIGWRECVSTSLASPAAPHPAQQAGDMVMVPRVPTEEMMYRGGEATSGLVDWGADSFPDDAPGNLASAVYAAMLAAAPAIPAQQAQPMTDEWAEAQRIRDLPAVDDAIRNMLEDQTGDNATCMVREVLRAGSLPAQQAGQPEDAEDAARYRWLRDRIDPREVREFFSLRGHNVDPAVSLATDAAIDRAMSSPTAKKGEGA